MAINTAVNMTPKEIVSELDKHIVGQAAAKTSCSRGITKSLAAHGSFRRKTARRDYAKNILMVGPTGVGKTEIARRLAKLVKALLLKLKQQSLPKSVMLDVMLILSFVIWLTLPLK